MDRNSAEWQEIEAWAKQWQDEVLAMIAAPDLEHSKTQFYRGINHALSRLLELPGAKTENQPVSMNLGYDN